MQKTQEFPGFLGSASFLFAQSGRVDQKRYRLFALPSVYITRVTGTVSPRGEDHITYEPGNISPGGEDSSTCSAGHVVYITHTHMPHHETRNRYRKTAGLFAQLVLQRIGIQDLNGGRSVGKNPVRLQFFQLPVQRGPRDVHDHCPIGYRSRDSDDRVSRLPGLHQQITGSLLGDSAVGKQHHTLPLIRIVAT